MICSACRKKTESTSNIPRTAPLVYRNRYMYGISSIYKDNCVEDAAMIAANAMKRDIIDGIECYTQDAEFDLDDFDI